jgi:hypothetical protein
MNRNNFWRFVLVLLVILWSVYELYPPTNRDLVQHFRERAVSRDTNFTAIVQQAQALQKARPEKTYDNLVEAIGTNDILRYFPFFEAKNETHPTTYILNRLQREAAGRIRLGIDLQGGTSFLVRMKTETLTNSTDTSAAVSQAVEVLRKRVDKFGVAEPIIQPKGKIKFWCSCPVCPPPSRKAPRTRFRRPPSWSFDWWTRKATRISSAAKSNPAAKS